MPFQWLFATTEDDGGTENEPVSQLIGDEEQPTPTPTAEHMEP